MEEALSSITTKAEAMLLEREIDALIESLYKDPGFEEAKKTKVRESTALMVEELIKQDKPDKVLRKFKEALEKLEPVTLTLSYEPTAKTVENLYAWIKKEINKPIVLDIVVTPHIIAGATVSYKGRYKDYSVAKTFDKSFDKVRDDVLTLITPGH